MVVARVDFDDGLVDGDRAADDHAVDRAVVRCDSHLYGIARLCHAVKIERVGEARGAGGRSHALAVDLPDIGQRDRIMVKIGGRRRGG